MRRFIIVSMKAVAVLALIVAAGLYIVVNHSEVRQELVCSGHWKSAPSESEKAYVQLNEYRWWVRLWSDSNGNATVQTNRRAMSEYISHITKIHDGRLALYSFHDYDFSANKVGRFRGGYRAANGEITIEFLPEVVFIGTCS